MIQPKKDYTAIILAAGVGSRIKEIHQKPKCLLSFKGKSLLERQINALNESQIEKINVVAGFKYQLIEEEREKKNLNFNIIINDDYIQSGNAYSLYLGLKNSIHDVLILDADILFNQNILENFIYFAPDNSFLCGGADIEDVECSKVFTNKNNIIKSFADKRHPNITEVNRMVFQGEAIGIFKLSEEYKSDLVKFMEELFNDEYYKEVNWEKIFNLFLKQKDFTTYKTKSKDWIEIDTLEDYNSAKKIAETIHPPG